MDVAVGAASFCLFIHFIDRRGWTMKDEKENDKKMRWAGHLHASLDCFVSVPDPGV